jgi:primosomal protein N' (replication factor Y) (superfamily II helicase)
MPQRDIQYADIILPLAVPQYYTYSIPDHLQDNIKIGSRVTVSLAERHIYTGIVRRMHPAKPDGYTIKPVLDLLDIRPLITEQQLLFWEWMADYYMCTVGEVYRAAVPTGLKLESETCVFSISPDEPVNLSSAEDAVIDLLESSPGISIRKIEHSTGKKSILPVIKSLLDKGVVTIEENLRAKYKPRTRDFVILHENLSSEAALSDALDKLEKRSPKQVQLIHQLIQSGNYTAENPGSFIPVPKELLMNSSGASPASLKALAEKGLVRIISKEVSRLSDKLLPQRKPYALSESQTKAYLQIQEEFKQKNVTLLHGITSSGKTEIYIHLIDRCIKMGKQVLYLLPEIALTAQIINRLQSVFGDRVGIYHSRFSDAERVEVYQNLCGMHKTGKSPYQVILGVRSSVFLPFRDLGLIIIDEEHENTYKQFDPAPRYNARDAAVVLAGMHDAKVLMGTATPSYETYMNTLNGRYGLVELFDRYLDIRLPEIRITNVRDARRKKQMFGNISPVLTSSISETLQNKEQVILFQNRRGFSPYILCNDCGWIPMCKHCDVSLTYHKKSNSLRCHYCGYHIPNPSACGSCAGHNLQTRGFGTEKVEDEIAILFPEARLARMDLDTTRSRNSYERIIEDFENRKIDILIGTQMISKGLDFDHVRVVGILDADSMLNFPDFRSFERSFQLMSQVSGRAGRKGSRGTVIIQTADPRHPVIEAILKDDYKGFLHQQFQERLAFRYPPYFRLVKLTLRHKNLSLVSRASEILARELRKILGERVVGPEFPLIARLFTFHQKCIIIKIERDKYFSERRSGIQKAIEATMSFPDLKGLQIIADVDPFN